jgi:superfamily II RNA helicase
MYAVVIVQLSVFCVAVCRNREVSELFDHGFGIHHAGMLRADRSLTERNFSEGLIKVWGSVGRRGGGDVGRR